jgi:hypothetical protein
MNDTAAATNASGFKLEFFGKVEELASDFVIKFPEI